MVKLVNTELLKQRVAYTIRNQQLRQELKIKEVELSEAQRTAGIGSLRINSITGQVKFSSSCSELLGLSNDVEQYDLSVLLQHIHANDRNHAEFVLKQALA